MLTMTAKAMPATDGRFFRMKEVRDIANGISQDSDIARLLDWVESYLMNGHPDLGRTGAVCPFTRQAARIDTVRLAISHARPEDEDTTFALIRGAFTELEAIPCKPAMRHFRTVIVGFPDCDSAEGIAMLKRIQRRHRFYSLARARMIGMMHAGSEDRGLWNPEFRPLRSPMPVLAIRHLVENDAPFAALHPALMVAYLARFPIKGTRRLVNHFRSG
ncbi:DUF6875 domain-containing protein [Ensifer sp. LC163]|uniref:DUF6875 domain-containing protein n=1 Tax=Ensifer sp. LC163 TaxID=1120652 RepID=UPI000812DC76|nr:hypothetical protein [Ensifer sp. LC163]OCP37785.1 hypothetical protein BC360_20740 [Ensifer sp. LC163]